MKHKSILILEDELTTLELLTKVVEGAGYSVHAFQRPDSACMGVLVREKIDLIILDLSLFHFDSTEIVKFMREKKVASKVPILVVSGRRPEEIVQAVKELEAKDSVAKPFKPADVIEKIRKIIG